MHHSSAPLKILFVTIYFPWENQSAATEDFAILKSCLIWLQTKFNLKEEALTEHALFTSHQSSAPASKQTYLKKFIC